jgi:hypothetical protein
MTFLRRSSLCALVLFLLVMPVAGALDTADAASQTDLSDAIWFDDDRSAAAPTDLHRHVPTIAGTGWTQTYAGGTSIVQRIDPDTATTAPTGNAQNAGHAYAIQPAPHGPDYTIAATLDRVRTNTSGTRPFSLLARYDAASLTYYELYVQAGSRTPEIGIRRYEHGTVTQLAARNDIVPAHGDTYRFDLAGDQLTAVVNGQPVLHVTDGNITHAGNAGFAIGRSSNAAGAHLNNDWRLGRLTVTGTDGTRPAPAPEPEPEPEPTPDPEPEPTPDPEPEPTPDPEPEPTPDPEPVPEPELPLPVVPGDGTTAYGLFVGKAELDRQPTSGNTAWSDMVSRVDGGVRSAALSIEVDSEGPTLVYGAAVIWARTHGDLPSGWTQRDADAYRHIVRDRLAELITIKLDPGKTLTRPARRIGAYALAADLINLPELDPELDARFRDWLRHAVHFRRNTGFQPTVWDSAMHGVGNTGFAARFSTVAAMSYLQDRQALDQLWRSWQRIFDNTIDHEFKWSTNDAHGSWQDDPNDRNVSSWYGVLPAITRDGNNMSGILPADIRRSSDSSDTPPDRYNYYDPHDFPGGMYTNYHYLSSHALLLTAELLHRAGYPARTFGDNGPLRVAEMIRRFAEHYGTNAYPNHPWRYYDVNSANQQQIHLINTMYPEANFPTAGNGQDPLHLLGFHRYTHSARVAG